MKRTFLMILVVLAAGSVLAGCGKKGPLEPPPPAEEESEKRA